MAPIIVRKKERFAFSNRSFSCLSAPKAFTTRMPAYVSFMSELISPILSWVFRVIRRIFSPKLRDEKTDRCDYDEEEEDHIGELVGRYREKGDKSKKVPAEIPNRAGGRLLH